MRSGAAADAHVCQGCGTMVASSMLACPSCHSLVHASRLRELSLAADAAFSEGRTTDAAKAWEEALALLPPASRQYQTVRNRLSEISRRHQGASVPPAPKPARHAGRWAAAVVAAGLLWKFKFVLVFLATKGKLLLLGLSKGSTVLSMLASVGVYWAVFGLWFGVGLVVSIYVHEIGHVAALRRYGVPASAPMFVPGLGAFIRVRHMPASLAEQARVALGGPLWGLFAALASAAAFVATDRPIWAAIAHTGAWLNIFNLTPVWQLDGSRAFVALSRWQRWAVIGVTAALWLATREGLLVLIGLVAVGRTLFEAPAERDDQGALALLVSVLVALSAVVVWMPSLTA